MKKIIATVSIAFLSFAAFAQNGIVNTNIDMPGFLKISREAAVHRECRRLSEAEFIRMSAEPGTVILDARSKAMFDLLHIKGAVNLSFPDITVESLAKNFPDKRQRILIYCNNNFRNEPRAFASKSPMASLNLSTYVSLYSYGYTNIFELGPLLDVNTTKIEFVRAAQKQAGN
jgi:hypothetical protein